MRMIIQLVYTNGSLQPVCFTPIGCKKVYHFFKIILDTYYLLCYLCSTQIKKTVMKTKKFSKVKKVKKGMLISVRVAKKYNMPIRLTRKIVTKYCAY